MGPIIVLESVASHDLWIWHFFFGVPGAQNNIDFLNKYPICQRLAKGTVQKFHSTVGGCDFNLGYYLANGISTKWATLVQRISHPQDPKRKVHVNASDCLNTSSYFFNMFFWGQAICKGTGKRMSSHCLESCRPDLELLQARQEYGIVKS